MGSGFSSGNKTSVVVIDYTIDADLAAAIQQSEVEARSRELALAAEQQDIKQCIAESLIPGMAMAFELQQSELAALNVLHHEPHRDEREDAGVANEEQPNDGLTRQQIDLLPMSYYMGHGNSNDECKICFSDYEIGDILQTLPCCHLFHCCCIDDWLTRSNTCPTCMKGIKEELRMTSPAPASVPKPPTPSAPLTPSAPPFYML